MICSQGIRIVQAGRLRIDEPNCEPISAAIGNQYNELARILLLVHNPGHPTVGPLRRRFVQEADVSRAPILGSLMMYANIPRPQYQIRKGVWTVCGVALANDAVPPAMVVGCMAIHLCKK